MVTQNETPRAVGAHGASGNASSSGDDEPEDITARIQRQASNGRSSQEGEAWRGALSYGDRGAKPSVGNAITILQEHPLFKGKIGYCERRKAPVILQDIDAELFRAGRWGDVHSVRFMQFSEECLPGPGPHPSNQHGIIFQKRIVDLAVEDVAMRNRFDPVHLYLEAQQWDGMARLNKMLIDYAGAPDTALTEEITRRWMIAAVARVYRPGCQADNALVLEGDQGTGKTSVFRELAGEWCHEHQGDLSTRDSIVECHGSWISELGDMASIKRTKDIESVKQFITKRRDQFVNKYDRFLTDWPRRFVFAASINPDGVGWIADPTGGRRFWPIPVSDINRGAIAEIRNDLWAEAVAAYKAGEHWWIKDAELEAGVKAEQAERIDTDSWVEVIERYINEEPTHDINAGKTWWKPRTWPLDHTTVPQVLEEAMGLPVGKHETRGQMRVAKALKALGFILKKQTIIGGIKANWWVHGAGP